ncbi:MAG: HAD hydrolase-like protein [Gemmatimonadetes bacterium]|nr:HAD hydrolase-like protein [Gemmatimonadota bacterium]
MGSTWLQTTRTVLPHLAKLVREMRPTAHLSSVVELDAESLIEKGVRAVLWDVDGTLMSHHASALPRPLETAVRALLADSRFRHAIVSNCQEPRLEQLGEIFPDVPVLLGYRSEEGARFRVRRGREDTWREGAADAWSPATPGLPIRKPSAALLRAAMAELGVEDTGEVLMVGDQYLTDIASANLAGVRSIKVPTLERASFPIPVRVAQALENVLYRLRHGRPRLGWGAES